MNTMTTIIVVTTTAAAIAFGANAYAKRDAGHHGDKIVSRIVKRLDLDDSQAEALKALQAEIIETRTLVKDNSADMKGQLSQMFNADSFDQGAALSLINERAAAFQANAPELVATAGTFIDSLSPEQKAQVQKFMDHKGKRFGHHRGHSDE
ncbi:MAG: Spy/CpxP family protein refolding chaperone [Granulosicoccaceae bacterium]